MITTRQGLKTLQLCKMLKRSSQICKMTSYHTNKFYKESSGEICKNERANSHYTNNKPYQ